MREYNRAPVTDPARDSKLARRARRDFRASSIPTCCSSRSRAAGWGSLPGAGGHAGAGEALRHQAGARPTSSRPRTRAGSATRRWSRCGCRTATWSGVRRRPAGRARSSWRWTSSTGATCTRSGTAAPSSRVPFPVDIAVYVDQGAVPRPRLRARVRGPEAGSPRRLAGQRAAVVLGRGEADRLRPGDVDAEAGEDGARNHLRQDQLPRARAGAARAARRAHRSLRRRDPAVGAADRPPAVPGRRGPGASASGDANVGRAPARARPAGASRRRR